MKRIQFLGIGLAAVLATGCTSVSAQPASSAPAGINQPSATSAASSSKPAADTATQASDPSTSDSAGDMTATFGKAFTWEDGLSLSVSKPSPFTPSQWAAGTDQFKKYVVFDVRVVNKTGKAWDPSLISATIQSSNKEGEEVFDSEKLGDEPSTKLLNGREVKYKIAFGVADPKDLVLEIAPDFEHDSAIFTS